VLNKTSHIDAVVLVGNRARLIAHTAHEKLSVSFAQNWQDAIGRLDELLGKDSDALVLVKASHGMELDKMVNQFVGE
jgi:UDP-N-acetylmuramyl pentapeptide synthase